jgi:hypothetical protein
VALVAVEFRVQMAVIQFYLLHHQAQPQELLLLVEVAVEVLAEVHLMQMV